MKCGILIAFVFLEVLAFQLNCLVRALCIYLNYSPSSLTTPLLVITSPPPVNPAY